jgi:hypothetical protein
MHAYVEGQEEALMGGELKLYSDCTHVTPLVLFSYVLIKFVCGSSYFFPVAFVG